MKTISRYSFTLVFFVTVISSLLILNFISAFMLVKLNKTGDDDLVNESYSFAGFEVCKL